MELHFQESKSFKLTPEQEKQVTIEFLRKAYQVPEGSWIEDGHLMVNKTYHGSHAFTEEQKIRKATMQDNFVIETIEELLDK